MKNRFVPSSGWLLLAGTGGLALAAHAGWRHLTRRALPVTDGTLHLPALQVPVEVLRDRWGVPHIYAHNETDLFFAQGFVHAQDRLFQMDMFRRTGLGRVSEVTGPSALESDRFARYFGWPRAAQAQTTAADEEVRRLMTSYIAGVNTFITTQRLPVEFSVLAYRPEEWTLLDTAAWGTVLAWGLSVNWESEIMRALLLERLGAAKAADLTPTGPDAYETILESSSGGHRLDTELKAAYDSAFSYLAMTRRMGSNNWAVSGGRTASGRPILANDPHLPPIFPALWYENHLHAPGWHVTGYTTPGVPGVIIGHNEDVAWGLTNAFPDVQDVYLERFDPQNPRRYEVEGEWRAADVVEEKIHVRGRRSRLEKVRYTHHGPVFSDLMANESRDLALRWTGHDPHNHLRALLDMNRASNWATFRDALRHWGFPSQNVVYADKRGNIGYVMPGRVPRRRSGAGLVPVPGWTSNYDWSGWIPFEELPVRFNPDDEVLVTANNRVHGSDFPHLLTSEWLPDYRARRIRQLLDVHNPLKLVDNQMIQHDTVSLLAQRFLQQALPVVTAQPPAGVHAAEALQLLRGWDYDMQPHAVAPSIQFAWLVHFVHLVMRQALGRELAQCLLQEAEQESFPLQPFHDVAIEAALRWLEKTPPAWVGDVKSLLRPALTDALDALQQHYGDQMGAWQWGRLHQLRLHNPLSDIPIVGRHWQPRRLAVGGDGYTVKQMEVSPHFPPRAVAVIPSCRLIMDVGAWDNSLAALPGGQSAHAASTHYQDAITDWYEGRYHPLLFSRAQVEIVTSQRLYLRPLESS